MGKKLGRPPKITKEWADEKAKILADYYKNGEDVEEVCVVLDICKDSYYKAIKISPDFADADKKGRETYAIGWWKKVGRGLATGKIKGNAKAWEFNVMNRTQWKAKGETVHSAGEGVTFHMDLTGKKDEKD